MQGPISSSVMVVQCVSAVRLFGALLFASLAFQSISVHCVSAIYIIAMASDLCDGFLARRLKAVTYFGKVLDLVSDKSLTIVSLLYAAARGISLLPLALIAVRELIAIGFRAIIINGTPLLPTNKVFGGIIALVLWSNTACLIYINTGDERLNFIGKIYWGSAIMLVLNIMWRFVTSRKRVINSLSSVE